MLRIDPPPPQLLGGQLQDKRCVWQLEEVVDRCVFCERVATWTRFFVFHDDAVGFLAEAGDERLFVTKDLSGGLVFFFRDGKFVILHTLH